MADDTAHLDAVAEAIWRAGWAEESSGRTWSDCIYRRYYRHMAQAAIDALQLSGQWCVELEISPKMGRIKCEPTPFPPRGELREDDVVFSRLVSPWVRSDA